MEKRNCLHSKCNVTEKCQISAATGTTWQEISKPETKYLLPKQSSTLSKARELSLFGHICIADESRLIKRVVFSGMSGKSKEQHYAEND